MTHPLVVESMRRYVDMVAAHPMSDKPFWQGHPETLPTDCSAALATQVTTERASIVARLDDNEWQATVKLAAKYGVFLQPQSRAA